MGMHYASDGSVIGYSMARVGEKKKPGPSYAEMQLLQQFEEVRFRPFCPQSLEVAVAIAAEIQSRELRVQPQVVLMMHPVGGLTVRLSAGWHTWSQQISIEQFQAEAVPGKLAKRLAEFMVVSLVRQK